MTLRVGILGGTFDPVHNAHLAIAQSALERLGHDRIFWIPTGAPGYREPAVAPAQDRVDMLKRALTGDARHVIDERELQAGATGFTIDTIKALQKENPETKFTLLMGADQYAKRASWHRWAEIEKLCEVALFARPGSKLDGKAKTIPMTPMDISASTIRARVARGEDISAMVPVPVAAYIRARGLYR